MNYTDETMDEIAAIEFPRMVSCLTCGELVPGLTIAEATEDAHTLGWQKVAPGGSWRCADCLIEEAAAGSTQTLVTHRTGTCQRGHSMDDALLNTADGRVTCRKCKAERDRRYHSERKAR